MKPSNFSFVETERERQIQWKNRYLGPMPRGWYGKRQYEHVLPRNSSSENLWEGIREQLPDYIKSEGVHAHPGVNDLLSSWILCANLYFPIRSSQTFKDLMTQFLKDRVFPLIDEIEGVELEFALEGELSPSRLLGEQDGSRGSGQTSPDVAFLVRTQGGRGVVLVESKYTEHSFYRCSARRANDLNGKLANPHPERCMNRASGYDYAAICHQSSKTWGRKYWQYLKLTPFAESTLTRCPAATAGYQLLRQHALANGILKNGEYSLVASCVALDERNLVLLRSLTSTGIEDPRFGWGRLFQGDVIFKMWSHQDWVGFVRSQDVTQECQNWVDYMADRYGL